LDGAALAEFDSDINPLSEVEASGGLGAGGHRLGLHSRKVFLAPVDGRWRRQWNDCVELACLILEAPERSSEETLLSNLRAQSQEL